MRRKKYPFYTTINHMRFYEFCYNTTNLDYIAAELKKNDGLIYDRSHSSRSRWSSLPDFTDGSKSRSDIPTTDSSPARSTRTDTLSSEPKSCPQNSFDNAVDVSTQTNEPSKPDQEPEQKLFVNLPQDITQKSKNQRRFAIRRKSKSLDTFPLLSKKDNNEVTNGKEGKYKQKIAKNKIKTAWSSLGQSKRSLWAKSKPVVSTSPNPEPGPSQLNGSTVPQQSVEKKVAAQVKRVKKPSKHSNKATNAERARDTSKTLNTHNGNYNERTTSVTDQRRTPPPSPAPPDPFAYLFKNEILSEITNSNAETYSTTREEVSEEQNTKEDQNRNLTSNNFRHILTTRGIYGAATLERLPDIDSLHEFTASQPQSGNLSSACHSYFDYDQEIEIPEITQPQNPGQDYIRSNRPCRPFSETEEETRCQNPEEDYFISIGLCRPFPETEEGEQGGDAGEQSDITDHIIDFYGRLIKEAIRDNYEQQKNLYNINSYLRDKQRRKERSVLQSPHPPRQQPSSTEESYGDQFKRQERQQNRNHNLDQPHERTLTGDLYEHRRRFGPSERRQLSDRLFGPVNNKRAGKANEVAKEKQASGQAGDSLPGRLNNRKTGQSNDKLLNQSSERLSGQLKSSLSDQKSIKISNKHSSKKSTLSTVVQAHDKLKDLSKTRQSHTKQPEGRPSNSFWKRDCSNQREIESPSGAPDLFDEEKFQLYRECFQGSYQRNNPEYNKPKGQFERPSLEKRHTEQYPTRQSPKKNKTNHMGRMGSLEDHERKVIIEFCHLLEKSKQLFNGLRELPQYGHKQWHSHFGRTFDVYTKLWKFQQQHRAVLDCKYGLKRWQIGEIASKIGQLYYHFYLRTSETAYLNEAFSFYYAIRGRSYYTKACKEDKCELIVKKLRYYARFIVVCLLLKKVKLVRELIKELDRQIIEYGNKYDPDDQIEWTVVVDEVKAFIQAEPVIAVIHPDSYPVLLTHRLSPLTTPPVERMPQMTLSLHEVLIVGSSSQQVKFSELTLDMFRMLQTLEREPTGEIQHMYDDSPRQRFNLTPSALNNKGYNLETDGPHSENPHKYLLFKPSPSQILVYLASGCNDLPPNGALLLYISADGQIVQPSKHPEDGYDIGGLITTSRNELYRDGNKDKSGPSKNRELQCFYPGDLYPFTRRPLFIIIDSDNSAVFQNIPRHFGQPMVVLMSPLESFPGLTITAAECKQQGSLFTLFLHSPLTAFCHCTDMHTLSLAQWERGQAYIDAFMAEASQIVTRSRIDTVYLNFMGDEFLRLLILRYMFCELVLRLHRAGRGRNYLTRSTPNIPDEIIEHQALVHIVMDLASYTGSRSQFHEPPIPTASSKE